jgi:hypothetical protein
MVSVKVKDNINFPKFNFRQDLLDIAKNVIIPDIHEHMVKEQSLDEKSYEPLSSATLKQKQRKGQSNKTLEATGKLKKLIFHKALSNSRVLISIRAERKDIGRYLQVDGVRSKSLGKRKFEFFGVSNKANKKAMDFMRLRIRRKLAS